MSFLFIANKLWASDEGNSFKGKFEMIKPYSGNELLVLLKKNIENDQLSKKEFYNTAGLQSLFGRNYNFDFLEKEGGQLIKINTKGIYYTEDVDDNTPPEKMIPCLKSGEIFWRDNKPIDISYFLITEAEFSNIKNRKITAAQTVEVFGKNFLLKEGYPKRSVSFHYDTYKLEPKINRLGSSWLEYKFEKKQISYFIGFRTKGNGDVINIHISIKGR